MYDEEDRRTLLAIARRSIECALSGEAPPPLVTGTDRLSTPAGVFVTLKEGEELRGCIGYIEPHLPLAEAVAEVAVKAACADPRFAPVTTSELKRLRIEISVLSPLTPIRTVDDIEVGRHGLVVSRGFARGLLLPQVATEYGWSREELLQHTCRKAGLPASAWKEKGLQIHTFTSEIFAEPSPS